MPTSAARGEVSGSIPGSKGNGTDQNAARGNALACNVPSPLQGSAWIGPDGGVLDIGPHRLIVPPGALTKQTLLSGTIPTGNSIEIDFQPSGLQFRKPAGLIFDVSSCGPVPNAIFIDEVGGEDEHIQAIYSNWWHTIAAPIEHFSVYALDV